MSSLNGQTIGFIGLGLMGKPMARNLKAAGAEMVIHNRSQGVIEELSGEGMTAAKTPADVAGQAETVILMLPDTPAVEKVLLGPSGLISGLRPGCLIIDMGTTKVIATRTFARETETAGGALSAAVTVTTWSWTDANHSGIGTDFDDILCVLNGFAGDFFGPCAFFGADLEAGVTNGVIDFDDVVAALDAFAGNSYFDNPEHVDPCP